LRRGVDHIATHTIAVAVVGRRDRSTGTGWLTRAGERPATSNGEHKENSG
jgi:hypothetical protein